MVGIKKCNGRCNGRARSSIKNELLLATTTSSAAGEGGMLMLGIRCLHHGGRVSREGGGDGV